MVNFRKITVAALSAAAVSVLLPLTVSAGVRTISKVEEVKVDAPVGNAPSLPYRVWVTYSDGTAEFRSVRWMNSSRATEDLEASDDQSINPVGNVYTVKGYITGDNTTSNGYPISAKVTVVSGAKAVPSNVPVAEPLPLNKVRITGDNRLTSNRELELSELLNWPVAQQLYNYRDTYGLSTDGYPEADGWDSPTTKLKGHGSGHYMSAIAFAYAGCQDPEIKSMLLANIRRMVNELRECQERTFVWHEELGRYWEARDYAPEETLKDMKGSWADFDEYKKDYKNYGYGYLNAIPAAHCVLIEKYAPYNNQDWVWAPYYSVHKQLAGLIDIANYVDDKEIADKALLIAKDMGLWVWNRMHYRTYVKEDGTQAERRAKPGNRYEMWNMYIAGEVGGMCESLSRLSEMVSDPEEKAHLLEAANCFDSPAFMDPLSKNVDEIRTRHANQHIPMIVGALRSYRLNNDPYYYNVAYNFWNFIQGRYRYAMGGVGIGEMFRQPYSQMTGMTTASYTDRFSGRTFPMSEMNETCCAYNLAKLSKDLNCFDPDDARYMDYYERVLYNQIVGSVNAHDYATTYQYSVGLNSSKPWGNKTPQESCCGGTGAENHQKYQEATYFVGGDTMWIALYMPSVATWDAKGVTVRQDCLWPAEKSTITVDGGGTFALKLRVPYWATSGFDVKLNGKSIAKEYQPSSYVEIPARKWSKKDVVEVIMPFTKHIDFGPDKMDTEISMREGKHSVDPMWLGTFMYGPLVMATTGIEDYSQATVTLDSDLSGVKLEGATTERGTDGNLYRLTVAGHTFVPDYYADENATRYFRIDLLGDPSAPNKTALMSAVSKAGYFNADNYTPASYSALSSEIDKANGLLGGAALGADAADLEIAALESAASGLKQASSKADKSALSNAITKAGNLSSAAYTADSYAKVKEAEKVAEKVYSSSESQQEIDSQTYALENAMADLVSAAGVDKSALREQMQIARGRRDAQNEWNEMKVKVPDYAPWAPHGFSRLMAIYDQGNEVLNGNGKNYSQEEVDKMASSLNEAINNMRPGNLPEPEDLTELNALVAGAKEQAEKYRKISEAVRYAEMVQSYVTDGSGTKDMIERAEKQLKELEGE